MSSAPARDSREDPLAPLHADVSRIRGIHRKALLLRFVFGAVASAIAGLVGQEVGPHAGGLFLAAPAILMATVTLVADDDGVFEARQDVHGASLGGIGLAAFGLAATVTLRFWPPALALAAAAVAWLVTAFVAFAVDRALLRARRGGRRQARRRAG